MGGWFDPEGEGWFDPEEGQGWFDEDFLEGGPTIVEGEFSFAGVSAFSGVGGSIAGGVFSFAGVADFSPFDGGDAAEPPLTTAKEDTLFLALAGDLVTDQSQYLTDLTASGDSAYGVSARFALTGTPSREIYLRLEVLGTDKNVVYLRHGNNGFTDQTYTIAVDGSYHWIFRLNSTTAYTSTATTIDGADTSIAWSTRLNPDTTGSGNILISEINIYDHTAGAWVERAQFTHAVATTDVGWTFTVGGYWDGAAIAAAPTNPITDCRVSLDFHNHVEFAQDWVAERTPHTTNYDQILEPVGCSLTGAQAEWAGQANVGYLAAQARELRGRMLSPLINEVYSRARTQPQVSLVQWEMPPPNALPAYKMDITKLRWVVVPPGIRWAWVRVHVRSWVTSGAAVPLGLSMYSMNRPHIGAGLQLGGEAIPGLVYHHADASITVDHSSSVGEWVELGLLPLAIFGGQAPGWKGTTTLGLAFAVDPLLASVNDANARFTINAIHVRPVLGEP